MAAEKTGRSCLLATRKELLVELRKVDHHLLLYTDLISQCISCIFFYSGFNVLLGQHTLKYQNSVYDFFPPSHHPLTPTYVIAHVVE